MSSGERPNMIDAPAIEALKKAGVAVVMPSDGVACDALRPNFNKRLDGRPALVALPHDARAAATALRSRWKRFWPLEP
jgi:hypothetical protein